MLQGNLPKLQDLKTGILGILFHLKQRIVNITTNCQEKSAKTETNQSHQERDRNALKN